MRNEMEEVLKVEENGEYTIFTYLHNFSPVRVEDMEVKVEENGEYTVYTYLHNFSLKSHYKTLEDVKRFHPDLEIVRK